MTLHNGGIHFEWLHPMVATTIQAESIHLHFLVQKTMLAFFYKVQVCEVSSLWKPESHRVLLGNISWLTLIEFFLTMDAGSFIAKKRAQKSVKCYTAITFTCRTNAFNFIWF